MRTSSRPTPRILPALAILAAFAPLARAEDAPGPLAFGTIERKDPRLDKLIPRDATLEKLSDGYVWSEGPVWDAREGCLYFSDVPRNTVYRWKEGEGVREYLKPSGYTGAEPRGGEPGSNGLLMDASGRLVLCQHGDRRVARLEGGKFVTLADNYQGKRFNSPNDGTFSSRGDLYFTDPPYGLLGKNDDPKKELPFNGIFRLSKSGEVTLLTRSMTFPNGIGLSPDESTLYVANSDPARPIWMAFRLKDDGSVDEGRVFADASRLARARKGMPDGLKVDRDGNLFATGPGGVLVFAPDGTHLGTIGTNEPTANCAWGDDGSVLYITANMYLCRIKTATRGKGF